MKTKPKVTIILVNFNGLKDTAECLKSLQKINYHHYQVLVVDNASNNNEADILQKTFGDFITVIKSDRNTGFAEGNNIGIRQALKNECAYVLILNNDTVVQPDFLDRLVATAQQVQADMVSPKICDYYQRDKIDRLGHTYTKSGLCFDRKNNQHQLFTLSACCTLYSRKLLIAVRENNNYFDPDFFMYAEDCDLGFRAILQGFKAVIVIF